MPSASPLTSTFCGHIATTQDALLLFEACLSGSLNHVARRPFDRERASLIQSGSVFIFEEHSSGIKRWTDGVPWSPSRILGNFLVYRELEQPFPSGEAKRAIKRSRRSPGISKQEHCSSAYGTRSNRYNTESSASSTTDSPSGSPTNDETERWLIGSLVDSYGFKDGGLVKKTLSVTVGAVSHHLVSYYTVADVTSNNLATPSKDFQFQHFIPHPELVANFRMRIDEIEPLDQIDDRSTYGSACLPSARNRCETINQSISHHQMPLLTHSILCGPSSTAYQSCSISLLPGSCDIPFPLDRPSNPLGNHSALSHSTHPVTKTENSNASRHQHQQHHNPVFRTGSDLNKTAISPIPPHSSHLGYNFAPNNKINTVLSALPSSSVDTKANHDSESVLSQTYHHNPQEWLKPETIIS